MDTVPRSPAPAAHGGRRFLSRRGWLGLLAAGLAAPAAFLAHRGIGGGRLSDEAVAALYGTPLPAPTGPLRVFFLGHSLVARDMPAMLAQLAPPGHGYESQLGWGATLAGHWDPSIGLQGFDVENAHSRYRDAREALGSGEYDALVLTEMVEIRDAIRYHDSARYLRMWADFAWRGNPGLRIYLYETWHRLDDPLGWLERIDRDWDQHWDREVLRPALAADEAHRPIHVIPAGRVLGRFVRRLDALGGVEGLPGREGLFARLPDGSTDMIHLGDLGNYLVALAHLAVLYHREPPLTPRPLARADGSPATPPSPEAARLMAEVVWEVVTSVPKTGVPGRPS